MKILSNLLLILICALFIWLTSFAMNIEGRFADVKIQYEDKCGFANGGKKAYLLNSSTTVPYDVTVRQKWAIVGGGSGSSDKVYEVAAGQKVSLGCTRSDFNPVRQFTYTIVGQTPRKKKKE
jgi:hypothetical protein